MTIKKEITAFDFLADDAWDVGDLSDRITEADSVDAFNALAEEHFPDGATEEQLNDWMRFEQDSILDSLGIEDGDPDGNDSDDDEEEADDEEE